MHWADGRTLVLSGDIDQVEADALEREIVRYAERGGDELVVDVAGVTFFGSTGLGALVVAHRHGISITVRDPSPIFLRVLEVSQAIAFVQISSGDGPSGQT